MNRTASQMMPGAASATQISRRGCRCWRGGRRDAETPEGTVMKSRLGALGLQPRLLPQCVGGRRNLEFHNAAPEVRRKHCGGHEARRQQLLLDQALRGDAVDGLHVAVEADIR